ncbi:MAG: SAM-dependent methyltransferase [Gammaproteobacteria bacterium]|nr:SAM-dependent methyltransferase [Gammaproteobacteria bacterium]
MSRPKSPSAARRARPDELPPPGSEAYAHSLRLLEKLHTQISANGGAIPFEQYMQAVLYQPDLGYYRCGSQKFGIGGDFITAPELSPLFARCLAAFVAQSGAGDTVLEVGAGSGKLAACILQQLEKQQALPARYAILELSGELRQRQRETIERACPQLLERVQWLDDLPENFAGVVIANELLDAMPVRRFRIRGQQLFEQYVAWCDGLLCFRDQPLGDVRLIDRIASLREQTTLVDAENYLSEVNFMAEDWLRTLGKKLQRGVVLLIDYGYPRSAYYHVQRNSGTLMCHYQHRAHPDPLILPGLQDITAHIDFTAMADAALAGGMDIAGFATQGNFLLNLGLLDIAEHEQLDERERLAVSTEIKQLTLDTEMGEQFKVMACSKDLDVRVRGFEHNDLRHLL